MVTHGGRRNGFAMNLKGMNGNYFPLLSRDSGPQRSGPGILVFSHSLKLLHMNRRALDLTGQMETGPGTMILSRAVAELRDHIRSLLCQSEEAHATEFFEVKRVVVESGRTISLRGIGQPDPDSSHRPRIVMILEELRQPDARTAQETITQELCDPTMGRDMEGGLR